MNWRAFRRGIIAGLAALLVGFLFNAGGFAPFPPESAIEAFISLAPASIIEPAVQTLGEGAKLLGLAIASIIALLVYGFFGVLFERIFAERLAKVGFLSRFERFLVYSLIPFLFFGVVVLWVAGAGPLGLASLDQMSSSSFSVYIFPATLLLSQLVFGAMLSAQYPSAGFARREQFQVQLGDPSKYSRRTFIEKGVILAGSFVFIALGLDGALQLLGGQGPSGGPAILPGTPYNAQNAPSLFQDPRLQPLLDSEVTSNDAFYKVTKNLFDPQVNEGSWSLAIDGLVTNPGKTYSLSDLENNFTPVTQYTTFECVSNPVNGNLISNAKWTGVKISDLLSDVGGAASGAAYAIIYSVDGYSVGIPLSKALLSDSILAYRMNDTPLPQGHGYPLRAVIPGLYGMMSPKWVNRIELASSPYSGYWQTRGWTNNAQINTLAFIELPSGPQSLSQYNGSVILGGVAFAGDRGISKVEVSVDGGRTWQVAELKPAISNLTWTLWAFDWRPSSAGTYNVYARATDGTGALQTANQTNTFPNGATGYAAVSVTVIQ